MPVDVQLASTAGQLPELSAIQRWADLALEELGEDPEPPDLCIRLVDAAESQTLNSRFRGQEKPTNVLSFPADVHIPGRRTLGDVVICMPVWLERPRGSRRPSTIIWHIWWCMASCTCLATTIKRTTTLNVWKVWNNRFCASSALRILTDNHAKPIGT